MKAKSSAAILQLVAAGLLLLGTGCATVEKYSLTYRVWSNGDWRQFSEPAPNPNLALFETINHADLLVQYDALSEKRATLERRAYYLYPNQARLAAGTQPIWISPSVADGMKPIAVLPAPGARTNRSPELPACAVVTKGGREFTLYRPSEAEATFDLPVYAETSGTPLRLLLTPFAVTGDAVMVSAGVAVVGFFLWVQSGAPTR